MTTVSLAYAFGKRFHKYLDWTMAIKNVENEKLDIKSFKTETGDEDTGSFWVKGIPDDGPAAIGAFIKSNSSQVVQTFKFTDTDDRGFGVDQNLSPSDPNVNKVC